MAIDRAELPLERAADHRQHEAEQNIRADHFRRRHLGIIQQQHGAQRARARRRKSRLRRRSATPARAANANSFARSCDSARAGINVMLEEAVSSTPRRITTDRTARRRCSASAEYTCRSAGREPRPAAAATDSASGCAGPPDKMARRSAAARRQIRTPCPPRRPRTDPTISTSAGTVKLPPPMPVRPTASAIRNPIRIMHHIGSAWNRCECRTRASRRPIGRARIGAFGGNCGARLAADAAIAGIVKRQIFDFIFGGVFPDLAPRPRGQRTHLQQHFAAGQLVMLDNFQIFARGRLLAAQAREPDVEFLERARKAVRLCASGSSGRDRCD